MSKKSFIDAIEVKSPCSESWDEMTGNDLVRFCSHCSKNVNNLSEMTRKKAARIVRKSNGSLCVRYIKNSVTNAPVYVKDFVQIHRRAPSVAAGVMSASLLLSAASYAQGQASPASSPIVKKTERTSEDEKRVKEPEPETPKPFASLRGTVVDPNGAVISGAEITLSGEKLQSPQTTQSDSEGMFSFANLNPGTYDVVAKTSGFKNLMIQQIQLEAGKETITNAPLELAIEELTVGGVMVTTIEYDNPLMNAVLEGDPDAVRDLIAKGERVNFRDKENDNVTPLFLAVESGNIEVTRMLLEFGARVNARDSERQTPLMQLDDDATVELVEFLVRYGAKVNIKDKQGNTALILAAESAKANVVEALIQAGADVNAANDDGQTALMNAAYRDDVEMVRMLLLAGADVNATNDEGDTALELTDNDEIEELLVSFGAVADEDDEDAEEKEASEEPTDNPVN